MPAHGRAILAALLLASCTRKPEPPLPPTGVGGAPVDPSKTATVVSATPEKVQSKEAPPEKAPAAETPSPKAPEPEKRVLKAPEWFEDSERFYIEAQSLLLQGKKEEALEVLEDVLALDPTHKSALIRKSQMLRQAGRHAELIPDLKQALGAHPLDPAILEELALCQLAVGEPARALETVEQAIRGDATVPGARYIRALILAEMKDAEGALNALQDAVKNGYVDLATFQAEERFRSFARDPRFQEALEAMRSFQEAVKAARRPPGQTLPDDPPR